MDLSIDNQPVGALTAFKANARTNSKHQIRQIAESIKTFGFTNPVLIDRNNQIIAGHGRVEAAKRLGMSEVPTVRLEHLSETQIRAYVIADNKLAENAGWDAPAKPIRIRARSRRAAPVYRILCRHTSFVQGLVVHMGPISMF